MKTVEDVKREIAEKYNAWQNTQEEKKALDRELAALKRCESELERETDFLHQRVIETVFQSGGVFLEVRVYSGELLYRGKEITIARSYGAKMDFLHLDLQTGTPICLCQFNGVEAVAQLEVLGYVGAADNFVYYANTRECFARTSEGWKKLE